MGKIVAVIIITTVATFFQTSIGFGFGVFSMIFLCRIFPYGEAIALSQAFALVNTLFLTIRYHKHIQYKTMVPMLIPSVLLGIGFSILSHSIEVGLLKGMLGLVLVILSIYMLLYSGKINIKPNIKTGVAMGSLTGIGNGLFGIGGPPAVLYLLPATADKLSYLATSQAFFSINNFTNLMTRYFKGDLHFDNLQFILYGWLGLALGLLLGLLVFKALKLEWLKKYVYIFVGINGVVIIVQQIVAYI
ncbi:MAG: sulfite exporter TauE/SafE family protein [Sphaerochaetaceae bacterium]|jgi:uncharacterized membrane protein YfcA